MFFVGIISFRIVTIFPIVSKFLAFAVRISVLNVSGVRSHAQFILRNIATQRIHFYSYGPSLGFPISLRTNENPSKKELFSCQ